MPEAIESLYEDGHIRVTRRSVSSPNSSHLVADISGVRYAVTTPERDRNTGCADWILIINGFFGVAGAILTFVLPPIGILMLLLSGGGLWLAHWVRERLTPRGYKHFTVYITTSRGETPFYTWVWNPEHFSAQDFDARYKDEQQQEVRCKAIVDAIRRAIEPPSNA